MNKQKLEIKARDLTHITLVKEDCGLNSAHVSVPRISTGSCGQGSGRVSLCPTVQFMIPVSKNAWQHAALHLLLIISIKLQKLQISVIFHERNAHLPNLSKETFILLVSWAEISSYYFLILSYISTSNYLYNLAVQKCT